MRAQSDPWYSNFLLRIGNGLEESNANDYVRLPSDLMVEYKSKDSIVILINHVFPNLKGDCTSSEYMRERTILSTRNEHVDAMNDRVIKQFPGDEHVYFSHDIVDDDTTNTYPLDFLNSITPNGLPPHILRIKKKCPVIRNLDPHNGLCNGTRLVVRGFCNNSIDAEIVNGQHPSKRVFFPRIPLSPSEDVTLPFKLKREQVPFRLSFAMTINKAQGRTIPIVGVYLRESLFSHGQLYIALSRGVARKTTWVLAKPNVLADLSGKKTKNIVYRKVLES
jgi:ATP-dependent DNA helicase PIF1